MKIVINHRHLPEMNRKHAVVISTAGGEIVFTGTPAEMASSGRTITAEYLRRAL